ncbi:MAG TPA: hypothetical protein VGR07_15935 [Thermoanaerobaculia bacterium]|nr:hypothetical protein [Thermoanaerobaculia bacterium]
MKQEILNQQQSPTAVPPQPGTPKAKARKKETTVAGKVGDWQRLLAPLAANGDELKHLEVPRARLAEMVAQAADLKKQQAAQRAAKQASSQQLQEMLNEGQRLANLLRQSVKQHYGIRSEKLAEFGLQPFRGRKQKAASTPAPATPPAPGATPPPVEVSKMSTDPASR